MRFPYIKRYYWLLLVSFFSELKDYFQKWSVRLPSFVYKKIGVISFLQPFIYNSLSTYHVLPVLFNQTYKISHLKRKNCSQTGICCLWTNTPNRPSSLQCWLFYCLHRECSCFLPFVSFPFMVCCVLPVCLPAFCSRPFFLKIKFLNYSYQQGDRLHAERVETD